MQVGADADRSGNQWKRRLNEPARVWICVAALIALWGLMSFWRLRGPIDLRYDAGVYYILGTSLAEGKGYRLLNEPGEIEAVQYPPLLPAIVAAHQWILGTDDLFGVAQALRLTYQGLYLILILLAFGYASRHLGLAGAGAVGALSALNFFTYYLSDLLFTEIPFVVVTLLFLLCAETDRRWTTAGCGVLAAAAFFLRTSGIALLAAWVVDALLKRRFRLTLVRVALAAIPLLAWQYYVHQVLASEDYRSPAYSYQRASYQFYNVTYGENLSLTNPFRPEFGRVTPSIVTKRFLSNLVRFPMKWGEGASLSRALWSWPILKLLKVVGKETDERPSRFIFLIFKIGTAFLGVLVLTGGIVMLRGPARLAAIYVGATSALICTTPWPGQATRYLMPITPILAVALLRGVSLWTEKGKGFLPPVRFLNRKIVMGIILAPIFFFQCLTVVILCADDRNAVEHRDRAGILHRASYFYFDETWRGFERAVEWMMKQAPPGSIVATACPHYLYLRTGLISIMPPFEADPARVLDLLESVPVDFSIVDHIRDSDVARRYAQPALESAPERWLSVYEDEKGGVTIYKRIHSSG